MVNRADGKRAHRHFDPGRVSWWAEGLFHLLVGVFAIICVLPFVFVVIISFSSEMSLATKGFSFMPLEWSVESYQFVFKAGDQLWRSYAVTVCITVAGTLLSLAVSSMYAYALYRKDFKFRKFFTFFSFFTMLFSGGLVPTYMVSRNILGLYNNYAALIIPLLVSPYNFIVLRTFFTSSIPDSLIDSAAIDGSGEYHTLVRIILPLALPGLATIGLFTALGYWNEWFTPMLYITEEKLYPLQYLLQKMEKKIDFVIQNSRNLTGAQMSEALRSIPRESTRMAFVVLVVVPIACAYPFFQRYFIAGLTVGAVKG